MGRVQRDRFETSPDAWLAARAALLQLFASEQAQPSANDLLQADEAALRRNT